MSTSVLYDSLLVHYLARELGDRLRARRLRRVRFDSAHRRFTLELQDHRLVWDLHPTRGWLREVPASEGADHGATATATEGWGGRSIRTQRRPRVRGVTSPLDERLLEIEIDSGGPDRASRFVVELMTNQWNVLALSPDRRILSVLWSRDAGGRRLGPGEPYVPPGGRSPVDGREGRDEPVSRERFVDIVASAEDPARALVRTLAWTSSLNVTAILDGDVDAAWIRYRDLAVRPEADPQLLEVKGRVQPYPLPLDGVPGEARGSLLDAFESALSAEDTSTLAPEVRAALEDRRGRAARRARRLREEAEAAPAEAEVLRRRADLLMARLRDVPKGAASVELEDFEGGTARVELDPAMSAVENAESLYDRARKRERAARRLPERVREAIAEQNRLESIIEALEAGTAPPEELARWLAELRPVEGEPGGQGERLPYRRFLSSGGLEIRVGRSGKANDELTFHHSSPDDIWLHARDVGGAHVILRWSDRSQNPPHRDLVEAAVLAAVNSRARTSGTVPVDWTRRKYVRSPRGAAPGVVLPDRVSTVFVEPDPGVEDRLAPG